MLLSKKFIYKNHFLLIKFIELMLIPFDLCVVNKLQFSVLMLDFNVTVLSPYTFLKIN